MSVFEIAFNLIIDNMHFFGILFIVWLLVDIMGYALLGKRK